MLYEVITIDPRGRCDIHIVNVKSKSDLSGAEGAMQYVGVVKTSRSAASIALMMVV